jgi:hypothetical protein
MALFIQISRSELTNPMPYSIIYFLSTTISEPYAKSRSLAPIQMQETSHIQNTLQKRQLFR